MTEARIFVHEIIDVGDFPESPLQEPLIYLMRQVGNGGTIFIQRSRQDGPPTHFVKAAITGIGTQECTCHTAAEAIVIAAETHRYRLSEGIFYEQDYYTGLPDVSGYENGNVCGPRPLGELDAATILPVDDVTQAIEDGVRLEMPDTTRDPLSQEIESRVVENGAVELMHEEPKLLWIRGVEPRDLEPSHADAILAEILESLDSDV